MILPHNNGTWLKQKYTENKQKKNVSTVLTQFSSQLSECPFD